MPSTAAEARTRLAPLAGVLVAVCALLSFAGLGARALWDQDEGMHAATAKVMVESGDWITPTFNGENFYDKPVLFTWMVAASLKAFGASEWAARLPAALCGLVGVLGSLALARRMFGFRAGLLGALVLVTASGWVVLSRSVVHDISLAAASVLALAAFWVGYQDDERRAGPWLVFWAASGLAVLAKGPVGLLPPFVAGVFLLARGEPRFAWCMRPFWGVPVLLAVAAPWYVAIALRNADFVSYFFGEKLLSSVASAEDISKARPFYFYVPVLAGMFLPWTACLPSAVARALRIRDAGSTLLLSWAGGVFVVFSLLSAKLGTYILPVVPPLALLVGTWLAELRVAPRVEVRLAAALLWALAAVTIGVAAFGLPESTLVDMPVASANVRGLAAVASTGLAIGAACLTLRRGALGASAVAAVVTALFLYFEMDVAPPLDGYRSSRDIGRQIDAMLPAGEPVPVFGRVIGNFDAALFYTDRSAVLLKHQVPLRTALRAEQPFLGVARFDDVAELSVRPDIWPLLHVVSHLDNKLLIANPAGVAAYQPTVWESAGRAARDERAESRRFIEERAAAPGAVTRPSGLVLRRIDAGSGRVPHPAETVRFHYHGTLRDGTVFDSSVERGSPVQFPLNQASPCWQEALGTMRESGHIQLTCPAELAYGDLGALPRIPPGAALAYELEFLAIVPPPAPQPRSVIEICRERLESKVAPSVCVMEVPTAFSLPRRHSREDRRGLITGS